MILIVCVDDNMGMAFNHRRQSQDRLLRRRLLERVGASKLWMSPYTARQFDALPENVQADATGSANRTIRERKIFSAYVDT